AAFRFRLDIDDRAVLHIHVQRAPDAAVRARRSDRRIRKSTDARLRLLERGDGAFEHTLAAAHAVGFLEARIVAGNDLHVVAAAFHAEDERALHLVTGAHTARAADALVHLELDERMGVVHRRVVRASVLEARRAQSHLGRKALELATVVGRAVQAL